MSELESANLTMREIIKQIQEFENLLSDNEQVGIVINGV